MTEQVLGVGSWVEVRNRFNGRWAPGFVVHRVDHGGFWVRRLRDDEVLPDQIPVSEVRAVPRMSRGEPTPHGPRFS